MLILKETISVEDLKIMASNTFGDLVKAVVDIEKNIIAVDAELHADLEALLLENGSLQKHLWGINFYPDLSGDDFVEFDSMINMRPSQNNMSRGVDSKEIQIKIIQVVDKWIKQ